MRCSSPGYFDKAVVPSKTTFQTPLPGSVQGLLTLTTPSSAPGVSAVNVARASQRLPARVSRSCHDPGMPSTLVSAAVATPALIPAAARAAAACSRVADQGLVADQGVVARQCGVGVRANRIPAAASLSSQWELICGQWARIDKISSYVG